MVPAPAAVVYTDSRDRRCGSQLCAQEVAKALVRGRIAQEERKGLTGPLEPSGITVFHRQEEEKRPRAKKARHLSLPDPSWPSNYYYKKVCTSVAIHINPFL